MRIITDTQYKNDFASAKRSEDTPIWVILSLRLGVDFWGWTVSDKSKTPGDVFFMHIPRAKSKAHHIATLAQKAMLHC